MLWCSGCLLFIFDARFATWVCCLCYVVRLLIVLFTTLGMCGFDLFVVCRYFRVWVAYYLLGLVVVFIGLMVALAWCFVFITLGGLLVVTCGNACFLVLISCAPGFFVCVV